MNTENILGETQVKIKAVLSNFDQLSCSKCNHLTLINELTTQSQKWQPPKEPQDSLGPFPMVGCGPPMAKGNATLISHLYQETMPTPTPKHRQAPLHGLCPFSKSPEVWLKPKETFVSPAGQGNLPFRRLPISPSPNGACHLVPHLPQG